MSSLVVPYSLRTFARFLQEYARCVRPSCTATFRSKITTVGLRFFNKIAQLFTKTSWPVIQELTAEKRKMWECFHFWVVPFLRTVFWTLCIVRAFITPSTTSNRITATLVLFVVEVIVLLCDTTISKRLERKNLILTSKFIRWSIVLGIALAIITIMAFTYTDQCKIAIGTIILLTIAARGIQAWMQNNIEKFIYEDPERTGIPIVL